MNDTITTAPPITIAPDVPDLLKERNAEQEFSAVLDLIRKCFPQARSLDVYLQEEWAEPTWIRVVIDVHLATNVADSERLLQQWRGFDEQFLVLAPIDYLPLFLVMPRYTAR